MCIASLVVLNIHCVQAVFKFCAYREPANISHGMLTAHSYDRVYVCIYESSSGYILAFSDCRPLTIFLGGHSCLLDMFQYLHVLITTKCQRQLHNVKKIGNVLQ